MKPRIKVITLGVDYLDRSLRFYRDGLGLNLKRDNVLLMFLISREVKRLSSKG